MNRQNDSMDTGIYLSNVLVANWAMHSFALFGPIFKDGAVLGGNSGTGKSTLIDALMTVITGSTDKSNYNMAASANASSKRTFLGYVKGAKDGSSDKGRSEMDFTTHIAAEFRDSMTGRRIVLGVAYDYDHLRGDADSALRRYSYEGPLAEDAYVVDDEAASWRDLKEALQELAREKKIDRFSVYDSKREYREAMLARFKLADDGFIKSIKSLLAITKSADIRDFVFESMCGVSGKVSTDQMEEGMQAWDEVLSKEADMKRRLAAIKDEIDLFERWKSAEDSLLVAQRAKALSSISGKRRDVEKQERELELARVALHAVEARNRDLEASAEGVRERLQVLNDAISADDAARAKNEASNRHSEVMRRAEGVEKDLQRAFSDVMNVRSVFDSLGGAPVLGDTEECREYTRLLEYVEDEGSGIFSTDPDAVRSMVAAADALVGVIETEESRATQELGVVNNLAAAARAELEATSGGTWTDRSSRRLIDWIEEHAGVRPVMLADAIDIKEGEEAWSIAVEGVLGNKRFDLIVPERDHKRAWAAYKAYPDRAKGSLVESSRIRDFMKDKVTDPDSLASKVVSADDTVGGIAVDYVRYHLGRVKCVFDMDAHVAADPRTPAVTSDGAYYRGFARAFFNEKAIRGAMIGACARAEAAEARRRSAQDDIARSAEAAKGLKAQLDALKQLRKFALGSESPFGAGLPATLAKQAEYDDCAARADAISAEIGSIDTSSVEELFAKLKSARKDASDIAAEIGRVSKEAGKLEERILTVEAAVERGRAELKALEASTGPLASDEAEEKASRKADERRSEEKMAKEVEDAKERRSEAWGKLRRYREANRDLVENADIDAEDLLNAPWEARARFLESVLVPELGEQAATLGRECSRSFMNEVAGRISSTISMARAAVKHANRMLSVKEFTGKRYEFKVSHTEDPAYLRFYKMVTDKDFTGTQDGLWSEAFYSRYKSEIEYFMDVVRVSRLGEGEKERRDAELRKLGLTDVRNYLEFEMIQIDSDGTVTRLSSGISSSSGGEWALPLYLVLASGLAKTYRTDTYGASSNTLRLALIDEAFAGIDDASAEEALGYFQSCGLQPIVATPEAEKTSRLSEMTSTRIDHFKGADGFGFAVSYDRDMED